MSSFLETMGGIAQALWAPVLLTAILLLAVGLVSIWAALSRRHWFLRALAVAAVVAPTAAIPGHDIVLAFLLQSAFVVVGTGHSSPGGASCPGQQPERRTKIGAHPLHPSAATLSSLFWT
jgi:hypothetical protein